MSNLEAVQAMMKPLFPGLMAAGQSVHRQQIYSH